MIWVESHLATRRASKELYNMEGFYRKKGGERELLAKEKIIFRLGHLFLEEGNSKGFVMQIGSSWLGKAGWKGRGPM